MAQNSKIEWTDHTLNLWWGCTKVHRGCDNCYAETWSNRFGTNLWGNNAPRKIVKSAFSNLAKWQKQAAKNNTIAKVFVGSMMDIFEKHMPLIDSKGNELQGITTNDLRLQLFEKISDDQYPNLFFQMLTKRPSNINKYIPQQWKIYPPKNVIFGTSPVDQQTFDTLIRQLNRVNGKKFLSIEPQLGNINLHSVDRIDWVIQGGESGSNRRPFDLAWARSIHFDCIINEIPYFFKQIDKVQEIPESLLIREFPDFMISENSKVH